MALADLHVHSKYSNHSSEWFLKKLGSSESYTEIEEVYRLAKKRGMSYVTITDHNTIEGALKLRELSPSDTFLSVEATAYFPENGCKVHIPVYGITQTQFTEIERSRTDIYRLREYIRREKLACSVAHAPCGVNGKLNQDVLEKLILLFDVFEDINGSRCRYTRWTHILRSLTPEIIAKLRAKHGIDPFSDTPWIKGFTGGSDDHAGLFIGATFTRAGGETPAEFLENIKTKNSVSGGRTTNYKSWTFSIYKIAYHFAKEKGAKPGALFDMFDALLFKDRGLSFRKRVMIRGAQKMGRRNRVMLHFLAECAGDLHKKRELGTDAKIDLIYDAMAHLLDELILLVFNSLGRDITAGDFPRLIRDLSAALPIAFLSAPFFTALHHLNRDYALLNALSDGLSIPDGDTGSKTLFFADTFNENAPELPGNTRKVTCIPKKHGQDNDELCLPCIYSYTPAVSGPYTFHIPSVLKSIELINDEKPSKIIIATPGPTGLLGLLSAKVLGIKCTGLYQTDYTAETNRIIGDERVSGIIETYLRWFYSMMDEVCLPGTEQARILADRNYEFRNVRPAAAGLL